VKQLLRIAAFIVFSGALVHAQTIADIARQERARRQGNPKAVVITNKDLKTDAAIPNTEEKPDGESKPDASPTTAAVAAEVPVAPSGPGGHDENWWRGQFEKVRGEIQRLETQVPVLEFDFNTANREFLERSYDPDGRGKKAIDEAKARMDDAKREIAKSRDKLTQLEEDLRRAGGPAGWTR
jgi:hypothetical protein